MLPPASLARTRKVWVPSVRTPVVNGVVQVVQVVAVSSRHWNVEPASLEVNRNVGVASEVEDPGAGPAVIDVSGPVVSAVKVR